MITPVGSGHDGSGVAGPNYAVPYTLGQLARLDLLIRAEVLRTRLQQVPRVQDEFQGLDISDAQSMRCLTVRSTLQHFLLRMCPRARNSARCCALRPRSNSNFAKPCSTDQAAPSLPRLERLPELFGLSEFEAARYELQTIGRMALDDDFERHLHVGRWS